MRFRRAQGCGFAVVLLLGAVSPGFAVDISPHRALYSLSLDSAKSSGGVVSNVVGARGAMYYQWGEECDGWTVEQRFRLRLQYADSASGDDVSDTLVTWESKDGLRYRFNERRMKNGEPDADIHGQAHLDGPGKGGVAEFERPDAATIKLSPGVLFPTAHTLILIGRAQAGDQFVSRSVFDGETVANAGQITAVIGPQFKPAAPPNVAAGAKRGESVKPTGNSDKPPLSSPLLLRPSWRMRLAFFSPDKTSEEPDYEQGMRLLDNGVSEEITMDYTDYVIRATLNHIEPLPRPSC
jgi:hypothetical protein